MARTGPSNRRRVPRKKKSTAATAKRRADAVASTSGLSIEDDRLVGTGVSFVETPNKGGDLSPRYLVFHYTAGRSATSSINWLTNPESKASAHRVGQRRHDHSTCPVQYQDVARGPQPLGWAERTEQLFHWDRDG